jgi:hypothetical protein
MKPLFSFFFLLTSIFTVGQINSGVIDSSSIAGQIVHRLTTGNSEIQSLVEQSSKKKFQGYRICDQKMFIVDSLYQLLDKEQVQTLLDSPDRTLRFVGFILFSRHNNIKETVVLKFLEIIKESYYPMITDGDCNHAVKVSDIGSFCYELIVKPNLLYKPSFKLSKGEKALLKKRLEKYKYEGLNS